MNVIQLRQNLLDSSLFWFDERFTCFWILVWFPRQPWRWRWNVAPKFGLLYESHGAAIQKTAVFTSSPYDCKQQRMESETLVFVTCVCCYSAATTGIRAQFLCRQSSGRSHRTFSSSHFKTSQKYGELIVWPAVTNSCKQSSWYRRKLWACSWPCSSPDSPFFISVSLEFSCTPHAFFSEG
jgi:hypothetical protein